MIEVCEPRVLRRIFGPRRWEITADWRKLHKKSFSICMVHQI
jgi:hypothetical protein